MSDLCEKCGAVLPGDRYSECPKCHWREHRTDGVSCWCKPSIIHVPGDERTEFVHAVATVINHHSQERRFGNTPDFILAEFAADCLGAFARALDEREGWYKRDAAPVKPTRAEVDAEAARDLAATRFGPDGTGAPLQEVFPALFRTMGQLRVQWQETRQTCSVEDLALLQEALNAALQAAVALYDAARGPEARDE